MLHRFPQRMDVNDIRFGDEIVHPAAHRRVSRHRITARAERVNLYATFFQMLADLRRRLVYPRECNLHIKTGPRLRNRQPSQRNSRAAIDRVDAGNDVEDFH